MSLTPLILSPALPSELLTYIVRHQQYPTTLIICSCQDAFLSSLMADVQDSSTVAANSSDAHGISCLLSSPLHQVAIARHIRIIFVPTVSHLRACLSVFSTKDSKVSAPPQILPQGKASRQPLLMVYGFLALHRDTSEWSAQGISSTATSLVEAARRVGLQAVVVDPPQPAVRTESSEEAHSNGAGDGLMEIQTQPAFLSEEVPVLSASARKNGVDLDDADWTGRTVTLVRVLGRWFRFRQGDWAPGEQDDTAARLDNRVEQGHGPAQK